MKLLYLLSLLFIYLINGQTIVEIRDGVENSQYVNIGSDQCTKELWLLVELDEGAASELDEMKCDGVGYQAYSGPYTAEERVLYRFSIDLPVSSGDAAVACSLGIGGVSIGFNYSYVCVEYPAASALEVSTDGDIYQSSGFNSGYSTLVEIVGLEYPSQVTVQCSSDPLYFSGCQIEWIGGSTYIMQLSGIQFTASWLDQSSITATLTIGPATATVQLNKWAIPSAAAPVFNNQYTPVTTGAASYNRVFSVFSLKNASTWADSAPSYSLNGPSRAFYPIYTLENDTSTIYYLLFGFLNENPLSTGILSNVNGIFSNTASPFNGVQYSTPVVSATPTVAAETPDSFYMVSMTCSFLYRSSLSLVLTNANKSLATVDLSDEGGYPYVSGRKDGQYTVAYPLVTRSQMVVEYGQSAVTIAGTTVDSDLPVLEYATAEQFNDTHYIITIAASDQTSGIARIELCSSPSLAILVSDLLQGDLNSGVFVKLVNSLGGGCFNQRYISIKLVDSSNNINIYQDPTQMFVNPADGSLVTLPVVPNSQVNSSLDSLFSTFSFSVQQPSRKESRYRVRLTFSTSGNDSVLQPILLPLLSLDKSEANLLDNGFYGQVNSTGFYIIDFTLPNRIAGQTIDYLLYLSPGYLLESSTLYHLLGSQSELQIKSSNSFNQMAPVVQQVTSMPDSSNTVTNGSTLQFLEFGWSVYLSAPNGLKSGEISIANSLDFSRLTFQFGQSDLKLNSSSNSYYYPLRFKVPNNCHTSSIVYSIYSARLVDVFGWTSDSENEYLVNPFLLFANIQATSQLEIQCSSVLDDTTPPTLLNLSIQPDSIDVMGPNRDVSITMTIQDLESGISPLHLPVVSLSAIGQYSTLNCEMMLMNFSLVSSFKSPSLYNGPGNATYQCQMTLPIGFGYTGSSSSIQVMISGISDQSYNFISFGSSDLQSFDNSIQIKQSNLTNYQPIVTSSDPFSTIDSQLTIYGSRFGQNSTLSSSLSNGFKVIYQSNFMMVVQFSGQIASEFTISVISESNIQSNTYMVSPIYKNSDPEDQGYCTQSSCGYPSKGYCANTHCICYGNWAGVDCQSTVLTTSPSFGQSSAQVRDSYSDDDEQVYRVINVLKIEEVDFFSNVISSYPLDGVLDQSSGSDSSFNSFDYLDNSSQEPQLVFKYSTTLNNTLQTNLTITIQYFDEASNITFLGDQVGVKQSSVKYLIEMDEYPFDSTLNHLNLWMKLGMSSTTGDCSFTSTGGDHSQTWVQIQIHDKILYSRFLNYGLVDGDPAVISTDLIRGQSNEVLDITNFISMSIPYYQESVLIDPDFNLLQSNKIASSESGAQCIEEEEKKPLLTKAGIAGVVVGAVVLLTFIGLVVAYIIIKNRQVKQQSKLLELEKQNGFN